MVLEQLLPQAFETVDADGRKISDDVPHGREPSPRTPNPPANASM
jgi:hypothetical protein